MKSLGVYAIGGVGLIALAGLGLVRIANEGDGESRPRRSQAVERKFSELFPAMLTKAFAEASPDMPDRLLASVRTQKPIVVDLGRLEDIRLLRMFVASGLMSETDPVNLGSQTGSARAFQVLERYRLNVAMLAGKFSAETEPSPTSVETRRIWNQL